MCSKPTDLGSAVRGVMLAAILSIYAGNLRAAESAPHAPRVLIVWAGTLLAIPGHAPTVDQSIVIRGHTIERISSGRLSAASIGADPAQTKTLDLSNLYVLPGLFDLHVHLTTEPDRTGS